MNTVVEQQIKAHAVPTEEKLRKDWQRTRALVQKRCHEQLQRDSAKFNKAKKNQYRREEKQTKRKQKRRHDAKV
ncbi:hypothetical protein KJ359_012001 [Pestalotiopsis sp. 9143b]|nr:hypothetical protein KJ359_012001 [Pestalotiopsis sp. 9143b]